MKGIGVWEDEGSGKEHGRRRDEGRQKENARPQGLVI